MEITFFTQNIEFFLFILFLAIFLYLKRKNLEIQGNFPILYMLLYKTKLGLDKMDKWSKKHPKTYLYLAYLSWFIGVLGMILMLGLMIWQLGFIIDNNIESGGGLVLPIKTDNPETSKIFYVPFWYWIIALFILAIVHEFAHGVIAQRFKIPVKSSGFAFLGIFLPILPAAFVEPDDEVMKKKAKWKQIAVLGAGSTSNLLFGFLFLFLWIFAASPIIDNTMEISQINFSGISNSSSFNLYNLSSGSIISLNNINDKKLILERLQNLSENETINISILNEEIKEYQIQTYYDENANRNLIGINNLNIEFDNKEEFKFLGKIPLYFERLLFWLWFLNIAIGMMNLLPLWITDGGRIAYTLLLYKFKEKTALNIYMWISIFSLTLIIFTIWPSLLKVFF